jgi:hypothetical protein
VRFLPAVEENSKEPDTVKRTEIRGGGVGPGENSAERLRTCRKGQATKQTRVARRDPKGPHCFLVGGSAMDRLLTSKQLIDELFPVTPKVLYDMVQHGRIPFLRPNGKMLFFRESSIRKWLASKEGAPAKVGKYERSRRVCAR